MRPTVISTLSAIAVGALPFIPWFLFSNSILAKSFFLIGMIDLVAVVYAVRMWSGKEKASLTKRPLLLITLGALGVFLLSAVLGTYFAHSFWGDGARITGIFFLFHVVVWAYVLGETVSREGWSLIWKTLTVSTGLCAVLSTIGVLGLGYSGPFLWFDLGLPDPFFGNTSFLGMYFLIAFIVGCSEFIKAKSKKWKIGLGISLAFILVSPILLNLIHLITGTLQISEVLQNPQQILGLTRASGAALIAAATFYTGWWLVSRISVESIRSVLKKLLVVGAIISCALGSLLLITPGSVVQNLLLDETTVARFVVWDTAQEAIIERPFLGWGPENFDRVFQTYYSPDLFEALGRVVWFDRAHNVVLDTLSSVGFIGGFAVFAVTGIYIFVIWRARKRGKIGEAEAILFASIPCAHFIQLQTAFDVMPTYALLGLIGGYALSLERLQIQVEPLKKSKNLVIGGILGMAAVASLSIIFLYEMPRQLALSQSLNERNAEVRRELVTYSLSRPSDFDGLHSTVTFFVASVFEALAKTKNREQVLEHAQIYLAQYIGAYEHYIRLQPGDYRAHIHHAYLLLLREEWGGEKGADSALSVLEEAERLSPRNPLTDVILTIAYVYQGDLAKAQISLQEVKNISDEGMLTKDLEAWFLEQKEMYPAKSFFIVGNI